MSDTGPMDFCLFYCGHLTGEIGNRSRDRHRTNGSLFVCFFFFVFVFFIVVISLEK